MSILTNSLFLSTKLLRLNCVCVTVIDVDGHAKRNITKKASVFLLRLTFDQKFFLPSRRFQKMYIFFIVYSIVSFLSHSV